MLQPLVVALLLSALPYQPAFAGAALENEPAPEWHKGPPRYILSLKEYEAYQHLKTAEARRAFVEEFWKSLDPTPGTPENERREEFWRRVERSNLLFRDSLRPGWMTDRGWIYILLGPPDGEQSSPKRLTWKYLESPPPEVLPALTFVFFRLAGGEFSLVPNKAPGDAVDTSRARDPDPITPLRRQGIPTVAAHGKAKAFSCSKVDSKTPVAYLPARPISKEATAIPPPRWGASGKPAGFRSLPAWGKAVQSVPGRIRLPAGGAAADYFFGPILATRRFRYSRAPDGTTLASLTLAIPAGRSRPPDLILSASIQELPAGNVVARIRKGLALDPLRKPTAGDPLLFQTGFALPPGNYRFEGTVIDERDHRGSIFSEDLTLPDFRVGLQLSDISIAQVSKEDRPGRPFADLPVALPDPEATFAPGKTVLISCQVYNATREGDGADLDVQYDFSTFKGDKFRTVGNPVALRHVEKESLAYSLSLAGWPEGRYRVRVLVADNRNGSTISRDEDFRIAAPFR